MYKEIIIYIFLNVGLHIFTFSIKIKKKNTKKEILNAYKKNVYVYINTDSNKLCSH